MKKTLAILAAISVFSVFASASDKISSNMVGFSRIEVPAGAYRLIGVTLQSLSGKPAIGIQELLSRDELYADKGGNPNKCDRIFVWHGKGYDIYTYKLDRDSQKGKWVGLNGIAAKVGFKAGDAFFYRRSPDSPATTLTLSGQAQLDNSTVKHALPSGLAPTP